mmetsp:Transcript_23984/g.31886  ORF Transcript_23984/g.31886 Transcript_23984/m.31886 type:complete len:203 (+) Transcript_23984:1625-2233(+)
MGFLSVSSGNIVCTQGRTNSGFFLHSSAREEGGASLVGSLLSIEVFLSEWRGLFVDGLSQLAILLSSDKVIVCKSESDKDEEYDAREFMRLGLRRNDLGLLLRSPTLPSVDFSEFVSNVSRPDNPIASKSKEAMDDGDPIESCRCHCAFFPSLLEWTGIVAGSFSYLAASLGSTFGTMTPRDVVYSLFTRLPLGDRRRRLSG